MSTGRRVICNMCDLHSKSHNINIEAHIEWNFHILLCVYVYKIARYFEQVLTVYVGHFSVHCRYLRATKIISHAVRAAILLFL